MIASDEIQLVVAIKKATLFKPPSGSMAHKKVEIKARWSSVKIPAKLINNLSLWSLSLHASEVSVYKNGKKTRNAIPIEDTRHPKYFETKAWPSSCKDLTKTNVIR